MQGIDVDVPKRASLFSCSHFSTVSTEGLAPLSSGEWVPSCVLDTGSVLGVQVRSRLPPPTAENGRGSSRGNALQQAYINTTQSVRPCRNRRRRGEHFCIHRLGVVLVFNRGRGLQTCAVKHLSVSEDVSVGEALRLNG